MKKLIIAIMLIVSTLTFSQNTTVGISINPNIPGLKVYEDPTYSTFLLIETTACTDISVKIYNVIGSEVTDFERLKNGIDMKNLIAGVYILQIKEGNRVQSLKLVYNPKIKKTKI